MSNIRFTADKGKTPIKWSAYIGRNVDEVIKEITGFYCITPFRVVDEIESEKGYHNVTLERYEHYADLVFEGSNRNVVDIFLYKRDRVTKLLEGAK